MSVGTGGAHAVAYHLRLFHDLLNRKLADDAAQVAFHHQTNQAFALRRRLGEELLRAGADRDIVDFTLICATASTVTATP